MALDVKLAALGEEGFVAEIVHRKSVLVPSQAAGVRMGGSVRMKPLVSRYSRAALDDFGADAEDGRLARRADPEVAMLHEEVDAVLFERDGEGIFLRDSCMTSMFSTSSS